MAKMTNDEWWRKKYGILRGLAAKVDDIEPDEVYEKNGIWPLRKLAAMHHYLGFYAPIIQKQVEKGHLSGLVFIDLCAGSGLNRLVDGTYGASTVAGTSLVGAAEPRFNHHFFVEPRRSSARALEQRLPEILTDHHTVYNKKRGKAVPLIAEKLDEMAESRPVHFVCFVDYAGFNEVTFEEMAPLFERHGDFVLNVQWRQVARARDAAIRTFENDALATASDLDAIRNAVRESLKRRGRGKTHFFSVPSTTGSYSYDMAHSARITQGDNPWLERFAADVSRRIEPYTEAQLRSIVFGGQRTLGG